MIAAKRHFAFEWRLVFTGERRLTLQSKRVSFVMDSGRCCLDAQMVICAVGYYIVACVAAVLKARENRKKHV